MYISFINKIYYIEKKDLLLTGKIQVLFDELDKALDFTFEISSQYPLKHHESESITFYNKELIELNHIMEDGSICIHTSHHTNLKQKLLIDFNSLKSWIEKYYINKDDDLNYEHIVVNESLIDDTYYSYIFTKVNYKFKEGDFGEVEISKLHQSIYKEKNIQNHIVQSFKISGKATIKCHFSEYYKHNRKENIGLFYFIKQHPAKYRRFIFDNWKDFDKLLSTDFLNYLHQFDKINTKEHKGEIIPIFIGYETVNSEIHWQVALLKIGNFPLIGEAEKLNNRKTGKWNSKLIDKNITWTLTRDSSYKYFFGRGVLSKEIINKKILIIGVGAVGSMVAKTLTRSGCKYIDIVDYDIKEPENVCRSEYMFQFGLNDKVIELQQILSAISPFVEINILKNEYFESIIKTFHKKSEGIKAFTSTLNKYDMVFDCTTDNGLMYILDTLKLNCEILNISITNHAQSLVCAFYPNIYHFVNTQFQTLLKNDLVDLYEPIGCWSPTFKASYNDVNLLIQMTLKHINILYKTKQNKNNFVITVEENEKLGISLREY